MSVCSEPANIPIYQLSIDQSLAEEVPKVPKSSNIVNTTQIQTKLTVEMTGIDETTVQIKRPTTLVLDCNRVDNAIASTSGCIKNDIKKIMNENLMEKSGIRQMPKPLYRSNSSNLHKRPSTFVPAATTTATNKYKLSSELDKIFVISNNRTNDINDENYDSIEVIDERRMKNMPKSDRARLYKSNTFICEEYYTNEQLACVIDSDTKDIIIEEKRE